MNSRKEGEPTVLDILSLDTYALLTMFVDILTEQAWRHLGIRMDPRTQETKKDLERASLAIECIDFMIGKLQKVLPSDEVRRLRSILADLQINYAREAVS